MKNTELELNGYKLMYDDEKNAFGECRVSVDGRKYYAYYIEMYQNIHVRQFYVTDHSIFDKLCNIKVEDGRDLNGLEYLEMYDSISASMTSKFYPFFRTMCLLAIMNGYDFSYANHYHDIVITKKCFYNSENDYLFEGTAKFKFNDESFISTVRYTPTKDTLYETKTPEGNLIKESIIKDLYDPNVFKPVYARICEELKQEEQKISAEKNIHDIYIDCSDDTDEWQNYNDLFDYNISPVLVYANEDYNYFELEI